MTPAARARAGRIYLERIQASNGSFIDDSEETGQPTPFVTSLILDCLNQVTGAGRLRDRAASYLLEQRSEAWTWNYWPRHHPNRRRQPYPDDLDDTAYALAALSNHDPKLIDGSVLAQLAKALTANETEPGGPYYTWLTDRSDTTWRDVDPVVNANLGYLLSLHGVSLPKLDHYLGTVIESNQLTSPYYLGERPLIYTLSRWYRGSGLSQLEKIAADRLKTADDPLALALSITSAINLNLPMTEITPSVQRLASWQQDDHWLAVPHFVGAPLGNIEQTVGSAALTTAFAIEALNLVHQTSHLPKPVRLRPNQPQLRTDIVPDELRRRYEATVNRLINDDQDGQITRMADHTATACGLTLNPQILAHLNSGSLHGWVAYTIYDDFLDDEGKPELLGVANLALRECLKSFAAALPEHPGFGHLVGTTLDMVDGANTWEVTHTRGKPEELPDYGDLAQLAECSWGHSLAACGVLVASGLAIDSPEVQQLQLFFHHFLIARQLNDDAHDWEDDLTNSHISAVISLLPYRSVDRIEELRRHFWEETIVELSHLIFDHLAQARKALIDCPAIKDRTVFNSWLDPLEAAAQQAITEREQTKLFIKTYTS